MNLELSESGQAVLQKIETFFADEILPRHREWVHAVKGDGEHPPFIRELRQKARAAGLWNLAVPTLPADAPAGTDPKLWSILTSEERGFFAKSQAMGPLTYGRVMAARPQPDMPAVRGGRLDIRG